MDRGAAPEEVADLLEHDLVHELELEVHEEARSALLCQETPLLGRLDPHVEEFLLETAGIVHLGDDGVIDLVEDARHCDEEGRPDGGHVLHHGVRALHEAHGRTQGGEGMELSQAEAVGPGQQGQGTVVLVELGIGRCPGMVVARPVHVHEEGALGLARGARGIDEDRHVLGVRIDGCDGILLPDPLQLRHRALALTGDQVDLLEGWNTGREVSDLVQDLRLGDEEDLCPAVPDDVLPYVDQLRLVHGHVEGTEAHGGVVAHGPVGAVVGDDAHGVAPLHADARESTAQVVHATADLPEGDPLICALLVLGAKERLSENFLTLFSKSSTRLSGLSS